MALYFAYGSNMDAKQMADRCSGAAFAGTAILPGYQFIINQRGYATLRPSAEHETPGVLWELNAEHEAALDSYEGFAYGLYDKCFREVNARGNRLRALVYIDHRNQRPGPPQVGYAMSCKDIAKRLSTQPT